MRIVIIGCGSIGQRHLKNLLSMGHEVTGVDSSETVRHALWEELDVMVNPPDSKLIGVDAVLICTPPAAHLKNICEVANLGLPFFVEKPLGANSKELKQLCCGYPEWVPTMVACNMRFHVGPATVKRLIDEGEIGESISARFYTGSYLPTWRTGDYRQRYSATIGAVLDCGSHELDLALWMLGPAKLKASLVRPATAIGLECDGLAEMLLEHESGAMSSVHVNFIQSDYDRRIEVIGTKGSLKWNWNDLCVRIWKPGEKEHCLSFDSWRAEINQMYLDEMAHFLECVRDGKPTCNPISEAVKTFKLLMEVKHGGLVVT